MSGSGADAYSNDYEGLWCSNNSPGKSDRFQGSLRENDRAL